MSSFSLSLVVSFSYEMFAEHVRESMGGIPTPARRLHFDLAERTRGAGRRHERR
jgi:hypothetical protein